MPGGGFRIGPVLVVVGCGFLWPLLVLSKPEARTAPVALGALVSLNKVFWNAIMVAAVLMTLPMLVLFLFLQRYFIAGIAAGAVK